jgi:thiamine biosynthesis lipoprotein
MGTMFDILVYHASRAEAERAIDKAMDEIVRLDRVMSHYKADSNLSRLNREGGSGFVAVEPSLYYVIQESIRFSRESEGAFDVTVAPLVRKWKEAHAEGRTPTVGEIADARKCVGFEKLQIEAPDRIRLRAACVEIDLGGIGKGYAVDRAIAILRAAGIERGLINAGGSSITSIGAPPGARGWPVTVGSRKVLMLRDMSLSTSQQNSEIIDPRSGRPAAVSGANPTHQAYRTHQMAINVVAETATAADALSTTLLIVPLEEGIRLLERFPGTSAIWISPGGDVHATHGESRLQLTDAR